MKIIHASHRYIKNTEPLTLTMGNFDGLHLGHQKLIERVLEYPDTKKAILTFDPHPSSILRKQPFNTLMQKTDKIDLLSQYPLDYLFFIQFNHEFSQLKVPEFIEFLKSLRVKRIVIGRDARFAYRGEGTVADLKKYFIVVTVDDVLYNHTRVSTTYVKDLLANGELGTVSKLLGRYHQIKGNVVHGNSVGKQLGFPTANIDYQNYYLPKIGTYYVKLLIDGIWYQGMANIGNNPTLNYSVEKRFEIYILDFDRDIYGKELEIIFLYYLRPEMKFNSKFELINQLKKDEESIRKFTF